MKYYNVKMNDTTYTVSANSKEEAVHLAKVYCNDEDGAFTQKIKALIADEQAAVSAYEVMIESLQDVVDNTSLEVLKAILKDENRHIENLQAVLNGTVTEKNLKDDYKSILSNS